MKYYKDAYRKIELSFYEIAIIELVLRREQEKLQRNPRANEHDTEVFYSMENIEELHDLIEQEGHREAHS